VRGDDSLDAELGDLCVTRLSARPASSHSLLPSAYCFCYAHGKVVGLSVAYWIVLRQRLQSSDEVGEALTFTKW